MDRFEALATFECSETNSTYVKGQTYRIRKGNDALRERVKKWLAEDKVAIAPAPTSAKIAGKGEVK